MGQKRVLRDTVHRPWPVPERPWRMAQTWTDLLFAHWPVPPEALAAVMPPQLRPDVRDGSAWIGVTPFCVAAFRLRGLPHVPGLTAFEETNVRTYATIGGRPGIFFLSLDAASRLAVTGARRTYRLPYFRARIRMHGGDGGIDYALDRIARDGPAAGLRIRYGPVGPIRPAAPGSLEHFLTERYCLYTLDEGGTVLRADIHHPPWPLQAAHAEIERNTMAAGLGLALGDDPLLHFSGRQDVVIWGLERA